MPLDNTIRTTYNCYMKKNTLKSKKVTLARETKFSVPLGFVSDVKHSYDMWYALDHNFCKLAEATDKEELIEFLTKNHCEIISTQEGWN